MDVKDQPPTESNPDTDDQTVEIDPSSTVLDLTSFQLHNLDSVELPLVLTELDLTANRLSSLDPRIALLSNLKKFSLRQNLIDDAAIEPFSGWEALSGLEVMENLENLTNLQELWLGRNRIKAVNLCGLKCIKKLSLQSNRLTSMKGFEECVALEELYLSHNGITKMEGLSTLVNLCVLDVSSNKLTSVDDIQNLTRLQDLWLNDNQIESLEGIADAIAGSRQKLTTIYLENNPCARSPNYATTLRQICPNIQQIDSNVFA
uniref:Protein phosphatase 1 regulatory subunit 7 n=1 Tax=Manihot esculenta TaxID=3983 RepID=A0A251J0H3_MANES